MTEPKIYLRHSLFGWRNIVFDCRTPHSPSTKDYVPQIFSQFRQSSHEYLESFLSSVNIKPVQLVLPVSVLVFGGREEYILTFEL